MDDPIIIGEGVILDVRPTSFFSRAIAIAIDYLVYIIGAGLLTWGMGSLGLSAEFERAEVVIPIFLIVTVFVLIPATVETSTRGRSLGKLVMGIRVVRDDGGPIVLRHALIRALVGVFEILMTSGAVAAVVSFMNKRGKRIGDYLAGTYAIRIRGGASKLQEVVMPEHLAPWASSADITPLPDGLALSVRQYLSRVHDLHPATRDTLGKQLADLVATHVAPAPPYEVTREEFLAAVIMERARRDIGHEERRREYAAKVRTEIDALPFRP